jgi:hypothetical protein
MSSCVCPLAGADVEAQEFETVADRVNFEIKKKLYERFYVGVYIFMIVWACELNLGPDGDAISRRRVVCSQHDDTTCIATILQRLPAPARHVVPACSCWDYPQG